MCDWYENTQLPAHSNVNTFLDELQWTKTSMPAVTLDFLNALVDHSSPETQQNLIEIISWRDEAALVTNDTLLLSVENVMNENFMKVKHVGYLT